MGLEKSKTVSHLMLREKERNRQTFSDKYHGALLKNGINYEQEGRFFVQIKSRIFMNLICFCLISLSLSHSFCKTKNKSGNVNAEQKR